MTSINEQSAQLSRYTVTARLWLAPDGNVYVDGDQPDGSCLFSTPGKRILIEDARRYGLVKGDEPAEDKALDASEDKALSTDDVKRPSTRVGR